jgi:hypothetical protein
MQHLELLLYGKRCSQFEFIFSCLELWAPSKCFFVKHRPQIFSSNTLSSSPVKGCLFCRMGVVNHLKELGSVSTSSNHKSLDRTMFGSRTSFPACYGESIIDWFFLIMSLWKTCFLKLQISRRTIYKLLLAKPLYRLRKPEFIYSCTIHRRFIRYVVFFTITMSLRRRIFFPILGLRAFPLRL